MSHPAISMTAWVAKQYIDGGYATLKGVNANYEAARLTYTGGLGSWGEVGQRFRWLFAPGSGFYCIRYGMHFNVNNVPTRATIDRVRLYLSIDSREVSDGPFTPQIAEANWYLTPFVSDAAYDAILGAATAGTWENIGAVELDTPYYTSDLSPDWVKRDGTYTQYGIRSALDYEGTPPDIGDMEDEPYSKDSVARFTHAGLWEPLLRIDYHVTRWHPYQMEGELDTGFEAADLDAINAQWTPGTEDWWGDSRATIEGGTLVSDGSAHGGSKYLKGTAADPSTIAWTMPFYPMKWSYSFWLRIPEAPGDDLYTIVYDENALQYGMDYYVDDGSGHPDSYYWYVETPGEGAGWTEYYYPRSSGWTKFEYRYDATSGTASCYVDDSLLWSHRTFNGYVSYWEWAAYFYLEPDGSAEIHLDDLQFSFDEGEDWAWYEDFETRTDGGDYPYTFGWSTAYSRYPTPLETEMRGGFTNHFARFQANNDYLDKPLELAPQQTWAFDLRVPTAGTGEQDQLIFNAEYYANTNCGNWETADHRWALLSLRYRASDDSFYLDTSPAWVIAGCAGGSFPRTGDWQRVSIYYDYINDRASVSVDGTLVASWEIEWPTNVDVSDVEVTWESSAVLPEYVAEPGEYFAWLWWGDSTASVPFDIDNINANINAGPPTAAAPSVPLGLPTRHRSVSLPISLWKPNIGSYEPRGQWVGTVDQWDSYEHTIARLGGYWKATFTVSGDMADTDWWLDEGLGLHVEVHDEAQVLIWEGFVDEVEATIGPLTVRRGPLTEVANSIRVHYQEIDNTGTVTDDDDWEPVATTLDDADSQARYGVLYQTFQADRLMTAEAEDVAAIYLAENAWPRTSKDWSLPGGSAPSVTVTCRGYVAFMDRYVYNNAAGGGVYALSAKIADVLDADVSNALFSSTNADITVNAADVVEPEQRERTAWEVLKSLVALGDGVDTRYSLGVYGGRRVVYEPWPSEIEYRQRIADPHQRTEHVSGLEVMPWNVMPGRWLMIPDLLVGRVPPDTPFASDPRVMMLREVTYRAPYELQLSQEDPDETEGRIAQIALRNQAW